MRAIPERAIALFALAGGAAGVSLMTDALPSMLLIWAAGGALCVGLRAVERAREGRNYAPGYEAEEPILARPRRPRGTLAQASES